MLDKNHTHVPEIPVYYRDIHVCHFQDAALIFNVMGTLQVLQQVVGREQEEVTF